MVIKLLKDKVTNIWNSDPRKRNWILTYIVFPFFPVFFVAVCRFILNNQRDLGIIDWPAIALTFFGFSFSLLAEIEKYFEKSPEKTSETIQEEKRTKIIFRSQELTFLGMFFWFVIMDTCKIKQYFVINSDVFSIILVVECLFFVIAALIIQNAYKLGRGGIDEHL